MKKIKTIAFYLPQFHQLPENDAWWGEGYTEWTAVKKAASIYEGHNQPRIPLHKRYYNLMDKTTMTWQVQLAKKANVHGFGFYHYWFKDNRKILEKPAENLLQWKELDMPFCFYWANESWIRTWSNVRGGNAWNENIESQLPLDKNNNGVLLEQSYGREKAWKDHFDYLLPFFLDERYIKIDGAPIFIIYKPSDIPCLNQMIRYWKRLAKEAGLTGVYVIGGNCDTIHNTLMDARLIHEVNHSFKEEDNRSDKHYEKVGSARGISYDYIWNNLLARRYDRREKTYLSGFVDYDNTPRHLTRGTVFFGASVDKFQYYFKKLVRKSVKLGNEFVFLNAWNEWGEGMYLEPDEKNGYGYLKAVRAIMKECNERRWYESFTNK